MVENPVSMEFEENSSDIELALDVADENDNESVGQPSSNGLLSKKVNQEKIKNTAVSVVDLDAIDSNSNDLSKTARIVEEAIVIDDNMLDGVELDSTSCKRVNASCNEVRPAKNLSNNESSHVNSHDVGENHIPNHSSTVRTKTLLLNPNKAEKNACLTKSLVLTNGFRSDEPSSANAKLDRVTNALYSLEVDATSRAGEFHLNNCDKPRLSNEGLKEIQINGNTSKLVNSESSIDSANKRRFSTNLSGSDDGSAEDRDSLLKKRLKIDDSSLSNHSGDKDSSINSNVVANREQKKKTTARKSVTATALKAAIRIVEEECRKPQVIEIPDETAAQNDGDGPNAVLADVKESPPDEAEKPSIKNNLLDPDYFSDESIDKIFEKMKQQFSRRQLEEIVLLICCEALAEDGVMGEARRVIGEYQESQSSRKKTIYNIERQMYQLQAVGNVFLEKTRLLSENHQIKTPQLVTRSVGLQVAMDRNPFAKFDSSSFPSRSHADCEDPRCASSTIRSNRGISDVDRSSGSSSPLPSSKPSRSFFRSEINQKTSLPSANDNASNDNASVSNRIITSPSRRMNNVTSSFDDNGIIDLTDKDDKSDSPPRASNIDTARNNFPVSRSKLPSELPITTRHPAPLPPTPKCRNLPGWKLPPPKPNLTTVQKNELGIQITWDLALNSEYALISKYQIYAYQETRSPASVDQWKSVGDVDSLPLPMACTLTQFIPGYTYHFAIRAIDVHSRVGSFSTAKSIPL